MVEETSKGEEMKTITIERTGWIPEGESEAATWKALLFNNPTKEWKRMLKGGMDGAYYDSSGDCKTDVGTSRKVRIKATLTLERELI